MMNRRHLLAAAGTVAVAGCLGQSTDDDTTATECDLRPVVLSNGRDEPIRPILIYVTEDGAIARTTIERVEASSDWLAHGSDSAPEFSTLNIIDGSGGRPDVTVECQEFPEDEELLVYFHPAGDIELRNAQSTDN